MKSFCPRDASVAAVSLRVESRFLMRILAITEGKAALQENVQLFGPLFLLNPRREIVADRDVVSGDVSESGGRKLLAHSECESALMRPQLFEDGGVLLLVGDHSHILVILGRGTHH